MIDYPFSFHQFQYSIFLVPGRSVTFAFYQDIRHPVRGSAHLIADGFYIHVLAGFDDKLIMDVTDDEAIAEILHGKAEKITGDRLHDVLHEFRTVAFNAFPFFRSTDTFIGDGFAAETVFTDTGLHIGEASAGRKLDEKHSAFITKKI